MTRKKRVTFIPASDFTGYPFGEKVEFRAGVESIPVTADYLALLHRKGKVAADSQSVAPSANASEESE